MLKKVTDQIINKDFKSVRKAYESVVGKFSKDKIWIVDVDIKDINFCNKPCRYFSTFRATW